VPAGQRMPIVTETHLCQFRAAKELEHVDCNEAQKYAKPKHRTDSPTHVAHNVSPVVTKIRGLKAGAIFAKKTAVQTGTQAGLQIELQAITRRNEHNTRCGRTSNTRNTPGRAY